MVMEMRLDDGKSLPPALRWPSGNLISAPDALFAGTQRGAMTGRRRASSPGWWHSSGAVEACLAPGPDHAEGDTTMAGTCDLRAVTRGRLRAQVALSQFWVDLKHLAGLCGLYREGLRSPELTPDRVESDGPAS